MIDGIFQPWIPHRFQKVSAGCIAGEAPGICNVQIHLPVFMPELETYHPDKRRSLSVLREGFTFTCCFESMVNLSKEYLFITVYLLTLITIPLTGDLPLVFRDAGLIISL